MIFSRNLKNLHPLQLQIIRKLQYSNMNGIQSHIFLLILITEYTRNTWGNLDSGLLYDELGIQVCESGNHTSCMVQVCQNSTEFWKIQIQKKLIITKWTKLPKNKHHKENYIHGYCNFSTAHCLNHLKGTIVQVINDPFDPSLYFLPDFKLLELKTKTNCQEHSSIAPQQ